MQADYPTDAKAYLDALLRGDREQAWRIVDQRAESGASVQDVYLRIFQAAQYEIGRLWETNQVTVAQEHYGTAATQLLMSRFHDRIFSTPRQGKTALVAGAGGELHELGPRMVADFLELEGWDTYFLGTNLPPSEIAAWAAEKGTLDLACLSCTMSHHVAELTDAVSAVRAAIPRIKILVGGRPFNQGSFEWRRTGADGYAADAAGAAELARRIA